MSPIEMPHGPEDSPDAPGAPDEESGRVESESPAVGVLELEALLFVAERPLSRREIGTLCGLDSVGVDELLGDLEVALRGRGVRLVSSGERVELATAREAGGLISRYLGTDGIRLSPAAMETLAIIAYRQPATRGTIERIRGVDSDYVVRGLLHRRLIVEQGRADTPGRPIRYGTGFEFMERFGLTSLDDLPPLDAEVAARLVEDEPGTAAEDAPENPAAAEPAAHPADD